MSERSPEPASEPASEPAPGRPAGTGTAAGGVLAAVLAFALIGAVLWAALALGPDGVPGQPDSRRPAASTPAPPTVSAEGFAEPVRGRVTSRFGPRPNPFGEGSAPPSTDTDALTDHTGVDLGGVPEGTTFHSVSDGRVLFVEAGGDAGGNLLAVDSGDGHVWRYLHAAPDSTVVNAGQRVSAGDALAGVGQTGTATGVHLHLELRVDGTPVDPEPYLRERGVELGSSWERPRRR